jgi:hypothetical protein
MQTPIREEELKKIEQKKHNKFDNVFIDALYNIVAYIPAAIITWFISNFDF